MGSGHRSGSTVANQCLQMWVSHPRYKVFIRGYWGQRRGWRLVEKRMVDSYIICIYRKMQVMADPCFVLFKSKHRDNCDLFCVRVSVYPETEPGIGNLQLITARGAGEGLLRIYHVYTRTWASRDPGTILGEIFSFATLFRDTGQLNWSCSVVARAIGDFLKLIVTFLTV